MLTGMNSKLEADAEDTRRGNLRSMPSPNDIFCLVKQYMRDDCLSQKPLLVFPGSLAGTALGTFQMMNQQQGQPPAVLLRLSIVSHQVLANSQ